MTQEQNNIQLLFKTLIYITFLVVCFNFYEAVNSNKGWQYTDWLINYQGGFTRRGLAGELILRFSLLTKIGLITSKPGVPLSFKLYK